MDPASASPVFQIVTFAMLPFELVEMVVAYATERSVLQLSRVNRVLRAACVPRMSKVRHIPFFCSITLVTAVRRQHGLSCASTTAFSRRRSPAGPTVYGWLDD